jgi:tRNA pseudouridine55 synthase
VNKPSGLTSHDVVARVRRILGTREVGHSGTLDPLASGLMVLLVGEATKLSSYVTEGDKAYEVGLKLGVTTDTLDSTGTVISEKQVAHSPDDVLKTALSLNGEFNLPVPLFSAKKIEGKKLYEYARAGEAVEIPSKLMTFWEVKAQTPSVYSLSCSKGSFIRSWVQLLGEKLGCGATMTSLKRTASHDYHLADAVDLAELEGQCAEAVSKRLVPLDEALKGTKFIRIKGQDEVLMKNGQISHSLRSQLISRFIPGQDKLIQILPEEKGKLLALVGLDPGKGFAIKRVFNY